METTERHYLKVSESEYERAASGKTMPEVTKLLAKLSGHDEKPPDRNGSAELELHGGKEVGRKAGDESPTDDVQLTQLDVIEDADRALSVWPARGRSSGEPVRKAGPRVSPHLPSYPAPARGAVSSSANKFPAAADPIQVAAGQLDADAPSSSVPCNASHSRRARLSRWQTADGVMPSLSATSVCW